MTRWFDFRIDDRFDFTVTLDANRSEKFASLWLSIGPSNTARIAFSHTQDTLDSDKHHSVVCADDEIASLRNRIEYLESSNNELCLQLDVIRVSFANFSAHSLARC